MLNIFEDNGRLNGSIFFTRKPEAFTAFAYEFY